MSDTSDRVEPDAPQLPGTEAAATAPVGTADLDAVERDLNDVETALGRLDDGTYWTDEVTGDEIPDDVLAQDPAARRA